MKRTPLFFGLIILVMSGAVFASDLDSDFDKLGGNEELVERARALLPEKNISVVQGRLVNRTRRSEFVGEFGGVAGGDSYLKTQNYGLAYHYHWNPRWSVGIRGYGSANQLSSEADNLIWQNKLIPDTDYVKSSYLALVNWYPIYGKLNLLDKSVAHFDFYLQGGYGSVELKSGNTATYSAGGGLGFWINPHWSVRTELRYQTYTAQRFNGSTPMHLTVANVGLGYLL